jgi:hypothetical protein
MLPSVVPFQIKTAIYTQQYAHLHTSTLKMEATCTSETLARPPTTTQYNNPRTQLTSIISYVLQKAVP